MSVWGWPDCISSRRAVPFALLAAAAAATAVF